MRRGATAQVLQRECGGGRVRRRCGLLKTRRCALTELLCGGLWERRRFWLPAVRCGALLGVLCAGPLGAGAQAPRAWTSIAFHFEREMPPGASAGGSSGAGTGVDRYTIVMSADGTGVYWNKAATIDTTLAPAGTLVAMHRSAKTAKIFDSAAAAVAEGACETKLKNVAQTGRKTIVVERGAERQRCELNYADDVRLQAGVDAFEAMALTMREGEKLAYKKRFDHLGLDGQLDELLASVRARQAMELENIAPILQSIAEDEEMMSVARKKAAALLEMAGSMREEK